MDIMAPRMTIRMHLQEKHSQKLERGSENGSNGGAQREQWQLRPPEVVGPGAGLGHAVCHQARPADQWATVLISAENSNCSD